MDAVREGAKGMVLTRMGAGACAAADNASTDKGRLVVCLDSDAG